MKMRKRHLANVSSWFDFVLLLSEQLPSWEEIAIKNQPKIRALTWEDVAIAIRKSLFFSNENTSWKAWAVAYLGAIEQKLLKYPYIKRTNPRILDFYHFDSMLSTLTEGQKDDK
jgi:hypothetical protein